VLFICDNILPHERRPGDRVFTRYAFRRADYFIVQSEAVERDLERHFPGSRYRRVPHPVYENFGRSLEKAQARGALGLPAGNIILYFGYVRPYKGLMVLIEAMARLRERSGAIGGVRLIAVGEYYDDESKYRDRVSELGLGESVKFVAEYIPNDRVAPYFSAADIVVLPYLSATQSGIVQIAYNFNKPVIATAVGGLAEVVLDGRTGFIVPPDDPGALADAVMRFYTGHRELEFTLAVMEEKKKYSWDRLVGSIEELARPEP
jgi:glycosyltransferase involved in cell wall biosynthesis